MDYHLIELCRVGDSSAIEYFVQTYQQDIFRLAFSILDESAEAEDEPMKYEAVWQPIP